MNLNLRNIWINTDGYKPSMIFQYPKGTEYVFSYIESRGGKYDDVVIIGLQIFIKDYLLKGFTVEDIYEADAFYRMVGVAGGKFPAQELMKMHARYNRNDGSGIADFPLEIKGVDEGTVVPVKNIVVSVMNTDPDFPWLTTFVETPLLRAIWYPSTVASNALASRKVILRYLEETGTPELIDYKLNDFGARGASSLESAMLGDIGFLATGFKGTDTLIGLYGAKKFYGQEFEPATIPAMEHSTVTSWEREQEKAAFANMVDVYGDTGILACVSDSYNIYEACRMWASGPLMEKVKASGACVVIRPDSGDPLEVIPRCLEILAGGYGATINSKGFKVLNQVRLIWGDGITTHNIDMILFTMKSRGWSADNIAFGQGGALLQALDRDTNKWAMKCSAIYVNGEGDWRDVYKDPITDPGKKSKKGLLGLYKDDQGKFYTGNDPVGYVKISECPENFLKPRYNTGKIMNETTFPEVRARVAEYLAK